MRLKSAPIILRVSWLVGALLTVQSCSNNRQLSAHTEVQPSGYTADGRLPLTALFASVENQLDATWQREAIYSYPDSGLTIRSWRTRNTGPALWLIAGLHGEEPAGPNAIARNIAVVQRLAEAGVPIVLVPVGNPKGYHNNWRYPNTGERDWRKGGYSVGDSEYLLPDLQVNTRPRAKKTVGPEAAALTQFALRIAKTYPPQLVIDLHEDELSTDGGYIYSQGVHAEGNPVGREIIRILQAAGIPLRMEGKTRFDEPIHAGVISRDDQNSLIRDGSIDELLGAHDVIANGRKMIGPAAKTVIVVETPAYAGARLDWRINAHGDVIRNLPALWRLNVAID
jgi:hypothetical protein